MTTKTLAALLFANNAHYLDHIAPLCVILGIPLFVTEKNILDGAKNYYPDLEVIQLPLNTCTAQLTKEYDCILTNLPNQMFEELFFFDQRVAQKKILNIWVPHGNSDKGLDGSLGKVLKTEKIVLYYGQKFFHEIVKHGFNPRRMVLIGNYRELYFKEHELFYEQQLKKLLGPIKKNVILFAPSWEHKTLELCLEPLMQNLDDQTTLLVKAHPNSILDGTITLEKVIAKYNKSTKLIINDFPIYPLLNLADALITDTSSIGYDSLIFNKPMILINPQETTHKHNLHKLGPSIFVKNAHLAQTLLKKPDEYRAKRQEAIKNNFSKTSTEAIREHLHQQIEKYFKQEIHIL